MTMIRRGYKRTPLHTGNMLRYASGTNTSYMYDYGDAFIPSRRDPAPSAPYVPDREHQTRVLYDRLTTV